MPTRTPSDAIRAAAGRLPVIVVTDLGLPGMDGYELVRALRGMSPGNPPVAAVAVTAYARLDDRARALAAGFQAHITKPVDPAALVHALVTIASRS